MADAADIQRELARRRIGEARQLQAEPQGGLGIQGMADVLSRSGMPIAGVIARPKEAAQMLTEGAGAAGGAALGTMVGGVPGAMVGGAGGARLGRAAGSFLFDEAPDPEELDTAGIAGLAGPAAGPIFRHSARIFAKLPTVQKAIQHAEVAAERARRAMTGSQAERTIAQTADRLDQTIARSATDIAKARSGRLSGNETYNELRAAITAAETPEARAAGEHALKATLDAAEGNLSHLATAVPRAVSKALTNAEMAVARGASAVPVPSATAGTIPGAFGALAGGAYAGMEGATSAAAFGYLFGQMRGRAAFRLSNHEPFVRWATGLTPRIPMAQAALAFVSDVILQTEPGSQEAEDAQTFFDSMLGFIEEFPEVGLGLIGTAEGAELHDGSRELLMGGEPRGSGAPDHIKRHLGTLGTDDPGWVPPAGRPLPQTGQVRPLGPEADRQPTARSARELLQRQPGMVDPQPFRPEFSRGIPRPEEGRRSR